MSFNPSDVGVHNGNIFGFPVNEENADLVIIPVPWDVTASYLKGTARAPIGVLEESVQLDFYHPYNKDAANLKIHMSPLSDEWLSINDGFNEKGKEYFEALEKGESTEVFQDYITTVNEAQIHMKYNLRDKAIELIKAGKKVAVLGGEHSTPLGLIEAHAQLNEEFGILQIDAHADLRESYEGFVQSHASIMFNALKCDSVSQLVQVGIRDISPDEMALAQNDARISIYTDWSIKEAIMSGTNWQSLCEEMVSKLPQKVYISADIDGLKPYLCPNTGTPVPGGLEFYEYQKLIKTVRDSGREIIGFDLCEVGVDKNGVWDSIVGARALWELCVYSLS